MRTTLTIEDDIAEELRNLSRARGGSFKAVVNEVLRRGLTTGEKPAPERPSFTVAAAARGFRAGVDPLKLNQLADELDIESFTARQHGEPSRK